MKPTRADVERILARLPSRGGHDISFVPLSVQERNALCHALLEARARLEMVLPEHAVCPEHGPFVKIDEDGCCATCGVDTVLASTKEAHDA